MKEDNFLDELLIEVEEKEQKLQLAHVDMVLREISNLSGEISKTMLQAEEEKRIIEEWALSKSSKLNDRVEWLTKKLEVFMNEQETSVRTIDLAHGQLLRRKQIEKLIVEDLDSFLLNPNLSQLTSITPEVVKPDLGKIKAFYKMSGKVPQGCALIESADKFSIKLKGGVNGTSKNGTGSQQTNED
ncbi:MAG: host-nuclease inhibitor Gam family protein [Melioribacteraceae bacterium]|nr:host-nuclease inhibitor Gam family protein [Melioribacteraceae bacterium]